MRAAAEPVVRTSDLANLRIHLRQLESGHAEKAVEDQHPSSTPYGDADVPSTRSPTSDAAGTVSEARPSTPNWQRLPMDVRHKAVPLLARLLRAHLARRLREGDER